VQIRNENRIVQPVAFLGQNEVRNMLPDSLACGLSRMEGGKECVPRAMQVQSKFADNIVLELQNKHSRPVPKYSGMKISSLPKIFQPTGKTNPEYFGVFPDLKLGVVLGVCASLMSN